MITLAALVLAFLASKYWHWAHVLTLVAFYFATVGFLFLAAQTLSLRLEWQQKYTSTNEQLEEQVELSQALSRGSEEPGIANRLAAAGVNLPEGADGVRGITRARHLVTLKNRARGRVWRDARPIGVVPETQMVQVDFSIRQPEPSPDQAPIDGEPAAPAGPPPALGMEVGSIVYVFEQGPLQGAGDNPPNQFLGEFRVDAVEGRQAQLQPLDQFELDPQAQQRYLNSQGPWIIYQSMPADDRSLFAGMNEEQLRALLPESTVQEYIRDNTPSTPDDPPERLVGVDADGNLLPPDQIDQAARTIYRRQLRDYAFLLDDLEKERAQLVAREQAITEDLAKLAIAQQGAEKIRQYRTAERDKWRSDLAAVERELAAIQKLVTQLQQQAQNAKQLLATTLQSNARLAAVKAERSGVLTPVGPGALDIDAL